MEASAYKIALARFAYHAAATHVLLAGRHVQRLLKANFLPDEPRVPRGNTDGGYWTRPDGSYRLHSGARVIRIGDEPHVFSLHPGMLDDEDNLAEFEEFPVIPTVRPHSASDRHSIVRRIPMAPFIGKPAGTLPRKLEQIGAPKWLREYYAHLDASTQGPRSLSELQAGAQSSRPGYDIHHIVEQTPAFQDGFPRSLIKGPKNVVSIPRFKHWEITRWFQTRNPSFGGLSPRDYLRGRGWDERYEIGIEKLEDREVLRK